MRNLAVIGVLVAIAAVFVHPGVLGFAALVVPLLLLEVFAARRSRPAPTE